MLVSAISLGVTTVYATPACLTISECLDIASEARDNIAGIVSQESELSDEIAELNGEITSLRTEVGNLEVSINRAQAQISDLQDDIAENVELLEETEADIEGLLELVGERMTVTQRMDNRNTAITLLSESEDITDFISQIRFFSRVANADADVMDQLADLLEQYDELITELYDQIEEREEVQEELETQQASLEAQQEVLADLEADLREELYELGIQRMSEEEVAEAADAAREILERTPPPPVVTRPVRTNNNNNDNNSNNSSNDSDSTSTNEESDDTESSDSDDDESSSSSNEAPASNPGTNSGMTHPMPGSRVTSEFGPRWGGHHDGIDVQIFGARPSILAAASGTVTVNTWHGALGWYVIISHDINGQRVDTLYAHMDYQSPVSTGTIVSQGQAIGTQGSTGFSTGAHLHFEVHPGGFSWGGGVNPRNWINF